MPSKVQSDKKNVSFSKKEQKLKEDINNASENYGFSTWMKLAAREKLARDGKKEERVEQYPQYSPEPSVTIPINPPIQKNTTNNMIDSMDDLFK